MADKKELKDESLDKTSGGIIIDDNTLTPYDGIPKYNKGDTVYYTNRKCKVRDRHFNGWDWMYTLETKEAEGTIFEVTGIYENICEGSIKKYKE